MAILPQPWMTYWPASSASSFPAWANIAAAYLLYPRYLDPETGLHCPPEVLVQRLTSGAPSLDPAASAVVAVRRATGNVRRLLGR